MTDREFEIQSYAAWIVATIATLEILKRNNAEGHAQQLEYVLNKFFGIAENKFGDDFLRIFEVLFAKVHGPIPEDLGNSQVERRTLH